MEHLLKWKYRHSLNFQIVCSCGWESHKQIMEADAKKEAAQHRANVL